MNRPISWALLLALAGCAVIPPDAAPKIELAPFRAPALPLFVQTPYLHTWLCGDRLADEAPKLWNGQVKGMAGMIRIDGRAYRFMGLPGSPLPAMRQDAVLVRPTRTTFEFSQDDVRLSLEFLSPTDPRDLRLLSLPLGFLRAEVRSATPREIQLYVDITGEWAVGSSDRRITWDGLFRIRPSQPRLFHETHNYPDWGEVRWAAVDPALSVYGVDQDVRRAFSSGGSPKRDTRYPRAANDEWPVFAHQWDLGKVSAPVARRAILGHLRREAGSFYGTVCPAYWTREHADGAALVAFASARADAIRARADEIDAEVLSRAHRAGGPPLASLAALAFRQSFAASELALYEGRPFYFSKSMDLTAPGAMQSLETLSSGAPALLAFNPELLAMQLAPLLEALRRGDWREPMPMNDLGAYPVASGQLSPGPSRPDAGAELLLLAALARLHDSVLDPIRQALLDAPPSLKSALAIGDPERIRKILQSPRESLRPEVLLIRLLEPDFGSPELLAAEVAELQSRSGKYGSPFDKRSTQVRVDASMALAALASPEARIAIESAILKAWSECSARVPGPDRFESETARPAGTQGRPAVGAIFAPLLLPGR